MRNEFDQALISHVRKEGCGMKKYWKVMVTLLLAMALPIAHSFAETDTIQITNISQNSNDLTIYLSQRNQGAASMDTYPANAYMFYADSIASKAVSAETFSDAGIWVYYTILEDVTINFSTEKAIHNSIVSFGKSMINEKVRFIAYGESIYLKQNYTTTGASLEQTSGVNDVRIKYYNTMHLRETPQTNSALLSALQDIGQSTDFGSPKVQHVIIVITDTDIDRIESNAQALIEKYHIPVYFIMLGSNSSGCAQYTTVSGGSVFQASANESDITNQLRSVRTMVKSTTILHVTPPYEVFQKGSVNAQVVLNSNGKKISSKEYAVKLTTNNVPTPSPSPVPTPSPTPLITENPVTPTPVPTVPPTPEPTDPPTPVPTETPEITPEIITIIITPEPTASPEPTPTPGPATIPPTKAPATPVPTAIPEPTAAPASNGFMDKIQELVQSDGIWIIGAGVLFVIAIIILLVILISSKKKKANYNSVSITPSFSSSDEEAPVTRFNKRDDPEATTYSKNGKIESRDSVQRNEAFDKTTSPFSSPQPISMFSSAASQDEDITEKTVSMHSSQYGSDEKTVRMNDSASNGLRIKFSIDEDGNTREVIVPINRKLVVGRASDCDVRLQGNTVSNHHLEITDEPTGLFIRDMNSSNGTILNGAKLTEPAALKNHDEIVLGRSKVTIELFM